MDRCIEIERKLHSLSYTLLLEYFTQTHVLEEGSLPFHQPTAKLDVKRLNHCHVTVIVQNESVTVSHSQT